MRVHLMQRVCSTTLRLFLATFCLLPSSAAQACLWDYDTLQQERSRFPSALELITGKFPRHSSAFYEWRVKDRTQKIEVHGPTAPWLDDLAVAYDKLGQHDQAIATMERAEKSFPGRYETAANLGTFYFHAQRFSEGIPHIERALQINPDAHFGRERYQLLLVKYILSRQVDGQIPRPLAANRSDGFREYVLRDIPHDETSAELQRATQGVLGMMRFGKHDSPVLLEVLGDLLSDQIPSHEPKEQQLAARAFLQASYVTADTPEVSATFRECAAYALIGQIGGTGQNDEMQLVDLIPIFDKERHEAQAWFSQHEQDEAESLARDIDPEARFAALATSVPEVGDYTPPTRFVAPNWNLLITIAAVSVVSLAAIGLFIVRWGIRWLWG